MLSIFTIPPPRVLNWLGLFKGQMVITENSPTDPMKGCRLEVSGRNGFSMRKYVISLTNYWNVKLLQFCTREHPGVSFSNVFMLLPIVIISMLMKEMVPQIPRGYWKHAIPISGQIHLRWLQRGTSKLLYLSPGLWPVQSRWPWWEILCFVSCHQTSQPSILQETLAASFPLAPSPTRKSLGSEPANSLGLLAPRKESKSILFWFIISCSSNRGKGSKLELFKQLVTVQIHLLSHPQFRGIIFFPPSVV